MTITPEFSRLVRLDSLSAESRKVAIEADERERSALKIRFDLIALDRLEAAAECSRNGDVVDVSGTLSGDVIQSCVASGEPVPVRIEEPFMLRFVPQQVLESAAEEVELSADDCDVIGYSAGMIDLGEAAAETLALALDPFPRSPRADEILRAVGVMSEEDAGPFAALKGLKAKLGKPDRS